MFIGIESYWRTIPSTLGYTWYYNIFAVLGKKKDFNKEKQRSNMQKIISIREGTIKKVEGNTHTKVCSENK